MRSSLLLPLFLWAAGSAALPTDGAAPAPASSRTVAPPATLTLREPDGALAPRASTSVNMILAWISELFPFDEAISDVSELITSADSALAKLTGWPTSQDGLLSDDDDAACADVLIVFARGTCEPGNVGALVGPPFFEAAESRLADVGKTLAVQGVDDYEASVEGFLVGGEESGSQRMADLVTLGQSQCPSSKIVMSGYSQGGQLVHNAAELLTSSTMGNISSVVIFGDPDYGSSVQGASDDKVLVICHDGDNICEQGDIILLPHLTYVEDADTAAEFIVAQL